MKEEREKIERTPGGGEYPVGPRPPAVLTLDGTFKAAATKKNKGCPGTSGVQSWLHLTRLKDGRLAAYWLLGNEKER